MLDKILGAAAGVEASKFTKAFDGPVGAIAGALAVPLVRRLSLPGLIVLTAGGYFAKKWLDKHHAEGAGGTSARKAAEKRAASSRKRTRRTSPKAATAAA